MMELGPKQKKWVAALRSGEYKQGRSKLCIYDHIAKEKKYCCLGVANEVLELGCPEREYSLCYKEIGRPDDEERAYEKIGLVSGLGEPKDDAFDPLFRLNDTLGKDFNEIADIIEKNPEQYFTHAV